MKSKREHSFPQESAAASSTFSKKDFEQLFHLPLHEAAISLNLTTKAFRRQCREVGISTWVSPRWQDALMISFLFPRTPNKDGLTDVGMRVNNWAKWRRVAQKSYHSPHSKSQRWNKTTTPPPHNQWEGVIVASGPFSITSHPHNLLKTTKCPMLNRILQPYRHQLNLLWEWRSHKHQHYWSKRLRFSNCQYSPRFKTFCEWQISSKHTTVSTIRRESVVPW